MAEFSAFSEFSHCVKEEQNEYFRGNYDAVFWRQLAFSGSKDLQNKKCRGQKHSLSLACDDRVYFRNDTQGFAQFRLGNMLVFTEFDTCCDRYIFLLQV